MDLTLPTRRVPAAVHASSSQSNRKARQALAAVALAGAGIAGALVGAPAAAAAPAVETVVAAPNGCTAVPDKPLGFDFKAACDAHDVCYETKPYGDSFVGRLRCDNDFFDNMVRHCKDNHAWWSPLRGACVAAASVYYDGVRKFGWAFF